MSASRPARGAKAAPESDKQDAEPTFHLFPRLVPELRVMIWETAFPFLKMPSRVFELGLTVDICDMSDVDDPDESVPAAVCDFREGPSLRSQTIPIRQLRAINHETQALLRSNVPDTLDFETCHSGCCMLPSSPRVPPTKWGHIRFRKETDIICLDLTRDQSGLSEHFLFWGGNSSHTICNLGLQMTQFEYADLAWTLPGWRYMLHQLSHLWNIYYSYTHMSKSCSESHKKLINLEGCIQNVVYRYPTIKMISEGQVDASIMDAAGRLKETALQEGWDLVPMLKMSPGLYSACLQDDWTGSNQQLGL